MFSESLGRNMDKVTYKMSLSARQSKEPIPVDVTLTETVLMWVPISKAKTSKVTSICTDNLLAVHPVTTGSDVDDLITYRLFFVEHFPQKVMRMNSVVLSIDHCEAVSFLTKINFIINGSSKPRRLLVFINPISGRKKGTTVYRKQMSPLFRICGIDVDVVGKTSRSNVAGLYQNRKLTVFAGLVLGFGLCGEMVRDCEKMRWLGPTRHSVAPLKAFFQRKTVDLDVISRQGATTSLIVDRVGQHCRLSGPMYSLDMWIPTLVNGPRKMEPTFGDSSLSLHAVHKCSFVDHLRHLLKVNSRQTGCFDYDFVKTIQGTGFSVCLQHPQGSTRKHYINHDGEHTLLTSPSFDVKLHEGAIKLFGTME